MAWADFMFAPGTFTVSSGTGSQQITNAACAQPKVILFFWTRATADATFTADNSAGFGVAVDAGTDQTMNIAYWDDDNVATTDSSFNKNITHMITNPANGTAGNNHTITMSSFNSDGFTINRTVNDGTNLNIIHYVCLGGSDITNAFLGEFLGPASTDTGKAYTGVGFQGDLGIFFGTFAGTAGTTTGTDFTFNLGFCKSASERAALAVYSNDGSGSANQAESYITDSKCLVLASGASLIVDNTLDLVSWDSDGFTMNHQVAVSGSRRFFGLILKGTFQSDISVQARATSATTQDITTVGFQPAGVVLGGTFATASATETVQSHLVLGAGEATGSVANDGIWASNNAAINTDANMYSSASNIYTQATNPSTVAAQAALNAWLSNGYQLNWGTADANARLFMHLALAGAASTRRPATPMFLSRLLPQEVLQ
jgi:hypothetical protein